MYNDTVTNPNVQVKMFCNKYNTHIFNVKNVKILLDPETVNQRDCVMQCFKYMYNT